MSMTGEAAGDSDIGERRRPAGDQSLGLREPQLQQIATGRLSRRCSEHPQEMRSAVAAFSGEGRKIDRLAEIGPHAIQHAAQEPARQGRCFPTGRLLFRSRCEQQPNAKRGRQ